MLTSDPRRISFISTILLAAFVPSSPLFAQKLSNHYAIILQEPAVAERFTTRESARSVAAENYRRQIEARQQSLKTELVSRKFSLVGSVSMLSNSVFVVTSPDRVVELQSLPGVLAVIPMRTIKQRMNRATQVMNAPAAWSLVGGATNAGAGIKVAILDTGIEQTHPVFQDSSLKIPDGFPKCTDNHPEDCAFTNTKVIVARSYIRQSSAGSDPANVAADSAPDDYSPRDREGHGTAVASVVAANQSGGPISFTGMAPKAYLGNYKIFGSPDILGNGGNNTFEDIIVLAINDAFRDGMDIANLSAGVLATTGPLDIGSTCGLPASVPCDFMAWNFEKAARAGLLITVSAGNDGDAGSQQYPTFNLISSPSNAPSVISVGATMNSHVLQPSISVQGGPTNLQSIAAQTSDGYSQVSRPVSGPLVDVAKAGSDGTACSALPSNSLSNVIALIQQAPAGSKCTFSDQAFNASDAGAFGVIFYMADSSAPVPAEIEDSSGNFPLYVAVVVSLSDGQALKSYVAANDKPTILVDPAGTDMDLAAYNKLWGFVPPLAANQMLAFSSPGPDAGDLTIKPDIVAIGGADQNNYPSFADGTLIFGQSGLYMAGQTFDPSGVLYTSTGYASANGTSFSAPIVAGAAAIVKQLHPNLTAAQIKSVLMNSAAQDTTLDEYGYPVDVISAGAGRLDAGAAAAAGIAVSAVTADGSNPVSLSFGALTSSSLPAKKQVQITNFGSSSVTLTVGVTPKGGASTVPSVDQSSVTVPAGASLTVNVSIAGTLPSAGEYSGSVTFQGSGVSLRVPYLFLVPSGTASDLIPLIGHQVATFNSCLEGLPGQDMGPVGVKLIDSNGVPLVGKPVIFSVAPRNSTTLGSASIQSVGYAPAACTPATSGVSTTCNTDQYGVAYAEVTLPSAVGANPTITARGAGLTFSFGGGSNGCAPAVIGQPNITSITDSNSPAVSAVPGSYIAISGTALANPAEIFASDGVGDYAFFPPIPLGLDGVNVSFDVPGSYDGKQIDYNGLPAPVTFVSADGSTLLVQVPWELQGASSAQVKVIVDGFARSNVITVPLVQYAPSLATNNKIVHAWNVTTNSEVTATNPAHAGDVVEVFANGLGPVNNQPPTGGDLPPAPAKVTTTTQPSVTVGGQTATVTFSGLDYSLFDSPFWFEYAVSVKIPSGLTAGNQPVVLSIGGVNSGPVSIPVQ